MSIAKLCARTIQLGLLLCAPWAVWAQVTAPAGAPAQVAAAPVKAASDSRHFSFVHMSDIHVDTWETMPADLSNARSYKCVSTIKDLDTLDLAPYNIKAPKPSFLISTGDNGEFGFGGVTGDVLLRYFEGVKYPIYLSTGNHDNTWVPPTKFFKDHFGGENYSFDFGGCHFIALNSCTLQDPNPSFGEETVRFIRNDLRKCDTATPIFCYCHHPLYGNEFASAYDCDRILDALRTHNATMFLVGHGHQPAFFTFGGIPAVEGGSPFTNGKLPTEGYNIVSVEGDKLRVAYRRMIDAAATRPLYDGIIPAKADYPVIQTKVDLVASGNSKTLTMQASMGNSAVLPVKATYDLDGESSGSMALTGSSATASIDTAGLTNGAHYIRFVFTDGKGRTYQRSMPVYLDVKQRPGTTVAKWRRQLGGSSRSTPLVQDGRVYIGANDGIFYAFEAATGNPLWTFNAQSEIACGAAFYNGLLLFGSGDGKFHALGLDGKERWVYDGKLPVFSSPVVDDRGTVYFGSNNAVLTALDAQTGAVRWRNTDAEYSIETKPLLRDGKLYVGAWDGYLYCISTTDGHTDWKKPGTACQKKVVRYYAPGDASPVIAGGKLYLTDRGYDGGVYELNGTFGGKMADEVTAFGTSQDGRALYLRNTTTGVSKLDLQTSSTWQSKVVAGRIPVAPIESKGRVFVITNRGELNVLDAATGAVQSQYRVTPRLYVMGAPAVEGDTVYACGQDGDLTAIAIPG